MSLNEVKNVQYVMANEGFRAGMSYFADITKRKLSGTWNADGRYMNGLDSALEYVGSVNRPEPFKQAAIELLREMTHDNQLYFSDHSGLKDIVDNVLSGRMKRKNNRVIRIRF